MRRPIKIFLIVVALVLVLAAAGVIGWYRANNQTADDHFDVAVARPTYVSEHPRVVIDAAHHNFHTATGRYRPLARLLENDGYIVSENTRALDAPGVLDSAKVLIIANASGWWIPRGARAARAAFALPEIEAVDRWVAAGGSLLLVADHYPFGLAASTLSRAFDVEMRGSYLLDPRHQVRDVGSPSWIVYDSANGGLGTHPILQGRNDAERVRRVIAFTGQSLSVPPGASPLLRSDTSAFDVMPGGRELSAAGRAQAVALEVSRGRVVVVGEAAMLTAQVTGSGRLRFGMNWPGTDNRKFALNVLHWLSRALK